MRFYNELGTKVYHLLSALETRGFSYDLYIVPTGDFQ
jgi:hypothetical protein